MFSIQGNFDQTNTLYYFYHISSVIAYYIYTMQICKFIYLFYYLISAELYFFLVLFSFPHISMFVFYTFILITNIQNIFYFNVQTIFFESFSFSIINAISSAKHRMLIFSINLYSQVGNLFYSIYCFLDIYIKYNYKQRVFLYSFSYIVLYV